MSTREGVTATVSAIPRTAVIGNTEPRRIEPRPPTQNGAAKPPITPIKGLHLARSLHRKQD